MGVTDTNYSALYVLSYANPTVKGTGFGQRTHVKFLKDLVANFNLLLTKLDSDAGVTDTNYNSTLALTDSIDTLAGDQVKQNGAFQGGYGPIRNHFRTNFNLLLAKLDADAGVTDTNYNALYNIAAVDSNQLSGMGINQGALFTRVDLFKTNFNSLLTKLDADT